MNQKGFINIALVILAVLILGSAGYYLYSSQTIIPQTQDETANWKTYTNNAFGFSIKLPSNNNVYTCENSSSRVQLANEKSYSVFILENPSNINLIKSCDYSEMAKYNHLSINAHQSSQGEYSELVNNWKKDYGDGMYVVVTETSFAGHDVVLKKKVEAPNNNNQYKEMVVNGGTYLYIIDLDKESDSLEKIFATFQTVAAKDTFSDWQTLKSNDLGIEIKYPYNYRADTVNSKLVAASQITIYPVPRPIEFGPRLVVSRNSDQITTSTSVDTYVDDFVDKNKSVKERGFTTINGTKWLKIRYLDVSSAGPEMTYVNYFAIKNGYMYTINYNETNQINTDNFEKIIGTIKFISIVSQPETTTSKSNKYTYDKYSFSFEYPANMIFKPLFTSFVALTDGVEADVPSEYNDSNSFQRSQKIYVGTRAVSTEAECVPPNAVSSVNAGDDSFNKYVIKGDCAMDGCGIGNIYTAWHNSACYEFAWFAIQSSYAKYYGIHSNDPYNDPGYLAADKAAKATSKNITELAEKILATFKFTNQNLSQNLPQIISITPSNGPVGTIVEIKGVNLSGFEGDLEVYFQRQDGAKVLLRDTFGSYAKTGGSLIKIVVKEPCQKGEIVYDGYSGKPYQCNYIALTQGVYKVWTGPWLKKSNEVSFIIQ